MLVAYARSLPAGVLVLGVLAGLVATVAVVLALRRGRRDVAGRSVSLLVLAGILLITLSPSGDVGASGGCDLRSWAPVRPGGLLSLGHEALNVWVFVALGATVALLPRRDVLPAAVLTLVLPLVVEGLQLLLPALGRSCQSSDLVANWTGGAAGLLLAALVHVLRSRPRARRG